MSKKKSTGIRNILNRFKEKARDKFEYNPITRHPIVTGVGAYLVAKTIRDKKYGKDKCRECPS